MGARGKCRPRSGQTQPRDSNPTGEQALKVRYNFPRGNGCAAIESQASRNRDAIVRRWAGAGTPGGTRRSLRHACDLPALACRMTCLFACWVVESIRRLCAVSVAWKNAGRLSAAPLTFANAVRTLTDASRRAKLSRRSGDNPSKRPMPTTRQLPTCQS